MSIARVNEVLIFSKACNCGANFFHHEFRKNQLRDLGHNQASLCAILTMAVACVVSVHKYSYLRSFHFCMHHIKRPSFFCSFIRFTGLVLKAILPYFPLSLAIDFGGRLKRVGLHELEAFSSYAIYF